MRAPGQLARAARSCAALTGLCLIAGACSGTAPALARWEATAPQSPKAAPYVQALLALQAEDARVAKVAYRLSLANAELCAEQGPQSGMVLHNAPQYGPASRPYASELFKLGATPTVLAIVPGSPAALAGFTAGDHLLAVNGKAFATESPPAQGPASYLSLQRAQDLLSVALTAGTAAITLKRNHMQIERALTARTGCAYESQLIPDDELNAYADGQGVFITMAMARYAQSDDDLALILAHELAHNILGHRRAVPGAKAGLPARAAHAFGTSSWGKERAADYLGLYLAARAGYNIQGAGEFWRRLGADDLMARFAIWSHPTSSDRAARLQQAIGEIERKRAAGAPLTPSF